MAGSWPLTGVTGNSCKQFKLKDSRVILWSKHDLFFILISMRLYFVKPVGNVIKHMGHIVSFWETNERDHCEMSCLANYLEKKGAIRDFAWITLFFYHTPLIQALIPLLEVSLEKLAFLFLCLSVRKAHSIFILHSNYERKTTYYHIFSSFLEKFCNQGCNDMSRYHRS